MKINQFTKLQEIYDSGDYNINTMLRINFEYNGVKSFLLYQNIPALEKSFSICWVIDKVYYFQSYYVKKNGDNFTFNPFLENKIYNKVIKKFKNKVDSPIIDYFNYVFNNLDKGLYIKEPKKNISLYCNQMEKDCIFFHCFRTANMSDEMKKKLYAHYKDFKLINFIESKGQTAIFSNDISKASDIYIEFSKLDNK